MPRFSIPPHPLTNFKIQVYFRKKPKFKMFIQEIIYLKNDGAYILSLNEYKSTETHWIALYVNVDNVTYFDSFQIKHISKEIKRKLRK